MKLKTKVVKLLSLFKKNTESIQSTAEAQKGLSMANPYLNAKRKWNEHTASVISEKQIWQLIGIISLLIALGSISGILYISGQSKLVPYIVKVNSLGEPLYYSQLNQSQPLDPNIIHATVASFINDARLVTPDIALQRKAVFRVYSMLSANDPSIKKMNAWLNGAPESNPFQRAVKESVNIEFTSILPLSDETWQADWNEMVHDRNGSKECAYKMRAIVTVYVDRNNSAASDEHIRNNPLGIYIKDFSWSKQL